MRIAFITSSLAPGMDGVGDYTRDLAAGCESLGHSCVLLALNDRHIDRTLEKRQSARDATLETLRLPASNPWPERLQAAQAWLALKCPDLISLQFVAYGFHPKGLIGDLGRRLAPLVAGRSLHLMLHELWIGEDRGAPMRQRLIGIVQRRAVLSLIRQLRPAIIHTSNTTYAALLAAGGVDADLLPLCGSIPVAQDPDLQWLGRELETRGVPASRAHPRDDCWRFGIFGTLLSIWSPEPLFGHIAAAARRAGRQVIIAAIGRHGPGHIMWQPLQRQYGDQFSFAMLGERSAYEVSQFFQSIDFGIAMTPWPLIGKSAATAAMLDHGVPVIVSRIDSDYGVAATEPSSPLLYRMDSDLPRWLLIARRQPPRSRLPDMAAQFIADVASAVQSGGLSLTGADTIARYRSRV
jgi:hypothetical protein